MFNLLSMKNCSVNFLKGIDLLGYTPQFYLQNKLTHNSILGGFISIFIWSGMLYALIAYTMEVLFLRIPNVVNYSIIRSDVPILNLSSKEHFEFMVLFYDDGYNIQTLDESIVNISFSN
jgi:hypothetical protein